MDHTITLISNLKSILIDYRMTKLYIKTSISILIDYRMTKFMSPGPPQDKT